MFTDLGGGGNASLFSKAVIIQHVLLMPFSGLMSKIVLDMFLF